MHSLSILDEYAVDKGTTITRLCLEFSISGIVSTILVGIGVIVVKMDNDVWLVTSVGTLGWSSCTGWFGYWKDAESSSLLWCQMTIAVGFSHVSVRRYCIMVVELLEHVGWFLAFELLVIKVRRMGRTGGNWTRANIWATSEQWGSLLTVPAGVVCSSQCLILGREQPGGGALYELW